MDIQKANLVIAEYTNDKDCYNCIHKGTGGGPKFHHQYPTCEVEGRHFEDFEGCNQFKINAESYAFDRSLDELLPALLKLTKESKSFDIYRITNNLAYYLNHPDEGNVKEKLCLALAKEIESIQ